MTPPIVVKAGGAVLDRAEALWDGVIRLRREAPVVLVHGGGPQATALARRLGHEPRIVHGRRVTNDLDLSIHLWAVRGELNAGLVARGLAAGVPTVGLSGADGGLVRVARRPPRVVDGATVDFGHVGDVTGIHPAVLTALMDAGFVPVVAPLGIDEGGRLYNVNADTVAQALAVALGASALYLVTGEGGVRRHPTDPSSYLDTLDAASFDAGVAGGWIGGGMRVKLTAGFEALRAGIPDVCILAPDDLCTPHTATRLVPDP